MTGPAVAEEKTSGAETADEQIQAQQYGKNDERHQRKMLFNFKSTNQGKNQTGRAYALHYSHHDLVINVTYHCPIKTDSSKNRYRDKWR